MKKILPIIFFLIANSVLSQTVSIRVVQANYSATDPDGAGPATGSLTIQFELMATGGPIAADGMGLSFIYQSSLLMATPTNTTTPQGPVASGAGWSQMVDNRTGTDVSVTYGGRTFDRRMIVTFNQTAGLDNISIPNTFTAVAQVTYWTLGVTPPEGGYITPEPGAAVPQNSLSAGGGLTSYDFLSPNLNSPLALGSSIVPVLFTKFDAGCSNNGAMISWSTGSEFNSNYFEVQRSINGNDWKQVGTIKAAGNSSTGRTYQQLDLNGSIAYYRIKQVDIDGHSIYTSIIRTNCQHKNIDIVIYPVPARDLLNVVIRSDKSLKTQLILVDGLGKIVRQINANIFNGTNTFLFNLKGLASGEYILRSNNPNDELNKKFNIVR
ncbi:MAG: T9SS type A sorting domain-containing protein [Ginsengibacter sp.]